MGAFPEKALRHRFRPEEPLPGTWQVCSATFTSRTRAGAREGVTMHNSTEPDPMSREDVESAVRVLST